MRALLVTGMCGECEQVSCWAAKLYERNCEFQMQRQYAAGRNLSKIIYNVTFLTNNDAIKLDLKLLIFIMLCTITDQSSRISMNDFCSQLLYAFVF